MPGFNNNMLSLIGMQRGGFAGRRGRGGEGMEAEAYTPPMPVAAPPTPSLPTATVTPPSPQATSMGARFGGYGADEGRPVMSPAATAEAGRLGTGIAPQASSSPAAPTMTPATGSGGMVGGTTLTPAAPSATGGGTGGLPTATLGGKFSREESSPVAQPAAPVAPQTSAATMSTPAPTTPSPAATVSSEASGYQKGGRYTRDEAGVTPTPPEPPVAPVEPAPPPPPQPPAPPAPPTSAMGGEDKYAQQQIEQTTAPTGGMTDPTPATPGAPPDPAGTGEYDQPGAGAGVGSGAGAGAGAGVGAGAPTGEYDVYQGTAPTGQSLLAATAGEDIAAQFGFDPGQYGGYFSPVSQQMRTAATEEGYAGFLGEQRAQLRETGGQQRRGLRASLLQDVMTAQQQGGATGFAGGGAQTQALGLARQGRQLGAEQLASQYGKGMYGVRQQIAGRVTAGEQALAQAQKSMYDRALELQRSGATMGTGAGAGTGAGVPETAQAAPGYGAMTQADVTAALSPEAQWSAGGGDPNDPTMAVDPTATPLADWQMGGDFAETEPEPAYDPLAGLPAYTQLSQQGAGETPYIQQMPLIKGTGKGPG